jgi:hypothetical protein
MKRFTTFFIAAATLPVFSVGAPRTIAQQENTAPPKPSAHAYPALVDANQQDEKANQDPNALQPDDRPLTGIQTPTLGSQKFRHSYWVPGFQYGNVIQSRSLAVANSSPGWSSDNYLAGNLSVLSTWSRAQFSLNYSGGGFLTTDKALGNGYYHALGMIQEFDWGRWQLQFLDQFSYIPEALFGFGRAIRLGVPGIGGSLAPASPGLSESLVPNQSIFLSTGTRYSNASAIETNYALTPRASITMAGSYGLLRFLEAGNIDSDETVANFGYNYLLTRNDTVGVLYRFTGYHYAGTSQAIGNHIVNLAYGRKITGRLALQLSGGPEIAFFRVPINGGTRQVLPYASASLAYGSQRGQVSLGYTRGVSGGGGVLVGSNTDQLTIDGNHQMGRTWTFLGSLGYARNRSLAVNSATNIQSFDSWVVTTGITHPIGPNASFSLGYTARLQTSNLACTASCNTNFTQHQISLGFQWNTRPFVIR